MLITPEESSRYLNIKYKINYSRLRTALETRAITRIREVFASDQIFSDYMDKDADEIPMRLYLEQTVRDNELAECISELDGSIWFASLLSRVDGLILMNPKLDIKGFGVEITQDRKPLEIFIAGNRGATEEKLRKANYDHFGTRHRSMMRYCSRIPNSIGIVISQDGDVRVMTLVNERLVMWENLKLQHHYYFRRKKRRTGSASS